MSGTVNINQKYLGNLPGFGTSDNESVERNISSVWFLASISDPISLKIWAFSSLNVDKRRISIIFN